MVDQAKASTQAKVSSFDKVKLEKDVSWIGSRLREPSTYAGLGAVLAVVGGGALDPGVLKDITMIGGGIGGLIAFFLPEGK